MINSYLVGFDDKEARENFVVIGRLDINVDLMLVFQVFIENDDDYEFRCFHTEPFKFNEQDELDGDSQDEFKKETYTAFSEGINSGVIQLFDIGVFPLLPQEIEISDREVFENTAKNIVKFFLDNRYRGNLTYVDTTSFRAKSDEFSEWNKKDDYRKMGKGQYVKIVYPPTIKGNFEFV